MGKKIIVLEDDPATAALIRFYLEEEGYRVAVSSRGSGFMEKVIEFQPELITIDVLLPDANGFEIFKKLSENVRTRAIPIVFITICEADEGKGIMMGAAGYLAKPFTEIDLKTAITVAIENKGNK